MSRTETRVRVDVMQVLLMLALVLLLALSLPAGAQTRVEYIHTDVLGNIVMITDADANVIERREYEPYGAQLTPVMRDGPGYTGHVQDAATGLVYMQQRYYDPTLGAFLSVDPVTAYGGDTRYFNRYWYAAGNPYKYTDPDGRALDIIADIGFIAYSGYKLATEPSWTNAAALAADMAGAVVPFATGLGAGVRAAAHGADVAKAAGDAAPALTQRAASRQARREAGIPTSQQPTSQTNGRAADGTPVGRQQSYEVPKPGGGTETKSVQVSRDIRGDHAGMSQVEAGTVKPGGQVDQAGRPRIQNEDKVRVDFEPRR